MVQQKTKPTFSIIVLNWNGKKWLKKNLDSIFAQTRKDFEVILTDNGSDDGSREYVEKNYPKVRILNNEKNLGYTGANNAGAKIAKGKFLIFLNNDTWFEKNFIGKLQKLLFQNKRASLIQPLILPYNEKNSENHIPFTGIDRFGYPSVMDSPFYVDGCCLVIKRTLFRKLDGFDNRYFIFHEDIDLSWRAQVAGYKVFHCKEAIVHHECGATVVGSMTKETDERHTTSYFRRYLSERNSLSNVIKNYQFKNLLWIVPVHISLGLGEALVYLLSGRYKASTAILKAIGWNFVQLPFTLSRRSDLQLIRKVDDSELFPRMIKGIGKLRAFRDIGGVPNFK